MARLAGPKEGDVIWDPFCGSGLELIERVLLGGVQAVYGTDRDPQALEAARANWTAINRPGLPLSLTCCDFRDHAGIQGLGERSVSLIITNPPMGRRVRVPQLRAMFADLFAVAARVLQPGGRLVFANPVRVEPRDAALRLDYRQPVDLGGFDCKLEKYVLTPA